jgi:hypothetical protein
MDRRFSRWRRKHLMRRSATVMLRRVLYHEGSQLKPGAEGFRTAIVVCGEQDLHLQAIDHARRTNEKRPALTGRFLQFRSFYR